MVAGKDAGVLARLPRAAERGWAAAPRRAAEPAQVVAVNERISFEQALRLDMDEALMLDVELAFRSVAFAGMEEDDDDEI